MIKCLKKQFYEDAAGYKLVPIRPEDIESIRQWRNEQMDVLRQSHFISSEEQILYFEQSVWPLFTLDRPKQILFSFLHHDMLIGYGGVTNLDWESSRAELSFLVDPKRANDSIVYARDMTHFLPFIGQVVFNDLQFHKLFGETFDFRLETIACLENFGFKKEGKLKEHVYKRKQWVDSVMLALLASDWEKKIESPPSVLITSISKKIPLIQAVRSASLELGSFLKIHGCDSSSLCPGQYEVDQFWHCPLLKELNVQEVIAYCQEHYITAIIPTRDEDLEFYAVHLPAFQEMGIRLMTSSYETINICLDKKRFADELIAKGFPAIPAFASLEDFQAAFYAVKERRGSGSRSIGLHLNRKEALEHSLKLKEPIFQPYMEGEEWSVDLYRSFTGQVKGCVARRRNLVVSGESQVTTTVHYPLLENLCRDIADQLNIHGAAVFQVIENVKGNFHVIECNPRFGGASTASIAVGLQTFFWFFAECLGLSLADYPFVRDHGDVRQIRYPVDRVIPWKVKDGD